MQMSNNFIELLTQECVGIFIFLLLYDMFLKHALLPINNLVRLTQFSLSLSILQRVKSPIVMQLQ